ncbi:MarR family winged helix-turn-helix transcriptional regulator [Leucobacter coleopterorum]|uniref:MarR family winged helix-turn-helix transcriptional regulator n=1 Tax=Leucobacter coleopterorum TaxID=2714933 RepID=UPI001FCAF16D|nr:MarR family winged helix-turn-helix transcriptional regulator [Leucobacter coleopterorum]
MTSSIDRLTGLGHVERTPNPTDRRGVIVTAKPDSAAQAMSFLLPMIYSVDGVLDRFSEEEQELVGRYLEQVSAAYAEHLDDGAHSPVDA